jgi:hypothetical protein
MEPFSRSPVFREAISPIVRAELSNDSERIAEKRRRMQIEDQRAGTRRGATCGGIYLKQYKRATNANAAINIEYSGAAEANARDVESIISVEVK